MRKRHTRFLISLLVLVMCLASLCITPALAYSDPLAGEAPPPSAAATTPAPEPSKAPAKSEGALSKGSGLVTRDLLYDKATNKQFITVQDKDGNLFYIIIDYDAPVNEEEEQYQTYFLSAVSTTELEGLTQNGTEAPVVCNCTDKCAIGSINTACPLCATNMTECAGKVPEPVEDPTPSESPAATEPTEDPKPESNSGFNPALLIVLVLALAAGGVVAYIKVIRPRQQAQSTNDPDEGDEDDLWDDEDEKDPFGDDAPDDADDEDYDDDDGGGDGGGTDDGGGET